MEENYRSLTPHYPTYRNACHFIKLMDGASYSLYRSMYDEIWEQRGNPQQQMDWSQPDEWILKRLTGVKQQLALKLWRESKKELNPRYLRGPWYFSQNHDLLHTESDILKITDRGQAFLNESGGFLVAETDQLEGTLAVLQLVAELGPGKRSTFLSEFGEFCRSYTTYRSEGVFKSAIYDRLFNLINREYISRNGQVYEVTDLGLSYLETYRKLLPGQLKRNQTSTLERQAKELREAARIQFAEYLSAMDPIKFEHLVKFLLEEMGYTDVEVTSPVNDKGVDVVANIELGISSVREVVQVKRHQKNINRKVLDQLRGSLHRFNAVRGTIISTGGFSKGTKEAAFEPGAAPITLIDGERLLGLLIDHEIGVKSREVKYFEFDETSLEQFNVYQ